MTCSGRMDCRFKIGIVFLVTSLYTVSLLAAERKQLPNLAGKPTQPRFKISDRVWPEKPGEASVCLWRDDKLCSVSITIDDNTAPDHKWWAAQGRKYGFRFTWFVITGQVIKGGYWGTWKGFAELRAMGHDIQSHTVTHTGALGKDKDKYDKRINNIEDEYRFSQIDLEKNISGNKCLVLAYPGGAKTDFNNRDMATKYYIGARGTTGLLNIVNQIDYFDVLSLGGGINLSKKTGLWAQFGLLLDPTSRYFRGWCCTHFHAVKEKKRASVIVQFDYLKKHETDVWVGLFREVVLYGQERDTARLTTLESNDKKIRLSLSDDMEDKVFTLPLTVKVRLPKDWATIKATQSGKRIAARVITRAEAKFGLVEIVPDQGIVVLVAGEPNSPTRATP